MSQIPEQLLIVTSTCPLKLQISKWLGSFFQIELLKTGHIDACGDGLCCGGARDEAPTQAEPIHRVEEPEGRLSYSGAYAWVGASGKIRAAVAAPSSVQDAKETSWHARVCVKDVSESVLESQLYNTHARQIACIYSGFTRRQTWIIAKYDATMDSLNKQQLCQLH